MFKKDNKGFTIIEVLIVLAIAGLILLIVFLAVPALQRNSRNQSIKADASNALSGMTDYAAANNGVQPTTFTGTCGVGDIECTLHSTTAGTSDVSFSKNTNTVVTISNADAASAWNNKTQTGQVHIITNAGCNNNAVIINQKRSMAARYLVETGNGNNAVALQCQQG